MLVQNIIFFVITFHSQVLVFSQMTRLLDILDYYFEERGYHTFRIDGSVKQEDRRDQVLGSCNMFFSFWMKPAISS